MSENLDLSSPAALRNRAPILAVLRPLLTSSREVLEVASGTGTHVVHFAAGCPAAVFQPTDPDADARERIRANIAASGLANVRQPLTLDVTAAAWPVRRADAVLCINMVHIAPWTAAQALFHGARGLLPQDGLLFLYGPFRRHGAHTAPSNAAFDETLRARDSECGVRDLEAVAALARDAGFAAPDIREMPANNLALAFRRGAT